MICRIVSLSLVFERFIIFACCWHIGHLPIVFYIYIAYTISWYTENSSVWKGLERLELLVSISSLNTPPANTKGSIANVATQNEKNNIKRFIIFLALCIEPLCIIARRKSGTHTIHVAVLYISKMYPYFAILAITLCVCVQFSFEIFKRGARAVRINEIWVSAAAAVLHYLSCIYNSIIYPCINYEVPLQSSCPLILRPHQGYEVKLGNYVPLYYSKSQFI